MDEVESDIIPIYSISGTLVFGKFPGTNSKST